MALYRLLRFLDSRGIDTVVFDIDNTLFATTEYYKQKTFQLGVKVAQEINPNGNLEKISRDIETVMYEEYERSGRKPSMIGERYLSGLGEYLGEEVSKSISELIINFFKDFYLHSPTPFEATPRVLSVLLSADKKIALHSHVQDEWTKVKVDLLTKLIGYKLPYLAIDINKKKDGNSWLKAFELVDSKAQKAMVVGDNFESDILPSVEIGCKNVAYVNRHGRDIPKGHDFDDSVEIIEVEDIGDILDISL